MAKVPDEARKRLEDTHFWHLATLNPDGSPQVSPVWADVDDDDHVLVNTFIGRRKEKNMRRESRVALSTRDKENPYANIQIQGRVIELIEGQRAEDHIDAVCEKYTGESPYPWRSPGERRVIAVIEPTRVAVRP